MLRPKPSILNLMKIVLITLLVISLGSVALGEDKELREQGELTDNQMFQAGLGVNYLLGQYHYSRERMDDSDFSKKAFDVFMGMLDEKKIYFYQTDMDFFRKRENTFYTYIKTIHFKPIYEIYDRFVLRVGERLQYVQDFVMDEIPTSSFENYIVDYTLRERPANKGEMEDFWRRKLTYEYMDFLLEGKTDQEAREDLLKKYELFEQRIRTKNRAKVFELVLNSLIFALDAQSSYFLPEISQTARGELALEVGGLGVKVSKNDDGEFVVGEVNRRFRFRSKLKEGDVILGMWRAKSKIFLDFHGYSMKQMRRAVRGPVGTKIKVKIRRVKKSGKVKVRPYKIKRVKVSLDEELGVRKSFLEGVEGIGRYKIGVLRLPQFYRDFRGKKKDKKRARSSSDDVLSVLQELNEEDADALILDLRNNGGGSFLDANRIIGFFIDRGPVIQTRDYLGEEQIYSDPYEGTVWKKPCAVLVNEQSASASELVAASLKDYQRCLVIGGKTYGKGTVQTIIDVKKANSTYKSDIGTMNLTMAKFFRVNGVGIQEKGVLPDVVLNFASTDQTNTRDHGGNYLEHESITPVTIPLDETFDALLPNDSIYLQKMHEIRAEGDAGLIYLRTKRERYKERSGEQVLPLDVMQLSASEELVREELDELLDIFFRTKGITLKGSENNGPLRSYLLNSIELEETGRILTDLMELQKL